MFALDWGGDAGACWECWRVKPCCADFNSALYCCACWWCCGLCSYVPNIVLNPSAYDVKGLQAFRLLGEAELHHRQSLPPDLLLWYLRGRPHPPQHPVRFVASPTDDRADVLHSTQLRVGDTKTTSGWIGDCLLAWCCACCVFCQEVRLSSRWARPRAFNN